MRELVCTRYVSIQHASVMEYVTLNMGIMRLYTVRTAFMLNTSIHMFTPSPESYGCKPVDECGSTPKGNAGQCHGPQAQRCTGFTKSKTTLVLFFVGASLVFAGAACTTANTQPDSPVMEKKAEGIVKPEDRGAVVQKEESSMKENKTSGAYAAYSQAAFETAKDKRRVLSTSTRFGARFARLRIRTL